MDVKEDLSWHSILYLLHRNFKNAKKFSSSTGCSRIYDSILKLYKQQTGKDSTKAIIFSERS